MVKITILPPEFRLFLDYSGNIANTGLMKYLTIFVLALSLIACSTITAKEEPFTVDLNSPKISIGKIQAQFDGFLNIGSIRTLDVTVDYYPTEDAVCLQYRIDFMTFYQFWNREGREAYPVALEKYKNDYAQRNLNEKGSMKTRRQYGRIDCFLIWQAASYTVRAKANTFIDLGYDIKNVSNSRAAFFTIYQKEAEFKTESSNELRGTKGMPMYLTRTQADELAGLFDQELIKTLVPLTEKRFGNTAVDSY